MMNEKERMEIYYIRQSLSTARKKMAVDLAVHAEERPVVLPCWPDKWLQAVEGNLLNRCANLLSSSTNGENGRNRRHT